MISACGFADFEKIFADFEKKKNKNLKSRTESTDNTDIKQKQKNYRHVDYQLTTR